MPTKRKAKAPKKERQIRRVFSLPPIYCKFLQEESRLSGQSQASLVRTALGHLQLTLKKHRLAGLLPSTAEEYAERRRQDSRLRPLRVRDYPGSPRAP